MGWEELGRSVQCSAGKAREWAGRAGTSYV